MPPPSWLSELLGGALSSAPTATATPSLALASALPPIPGKAVDKISKGIFIEFKELLADNVALASQLRELGPVQGATARSRMRDISDPLSWVYCFLSYVVVLVPDPRLRDLVAYGQIVIQLARSHGGSGWLEYDRRFHQQVAAGAPLSWAEINPSLMSATVPGFGLASGSGNCPLCLSWDHDRADCALASLDQQSKPPTHSKPYSRSPLEICRRFNAGVCPNSSNRCRFLHACSTCSKSGHPAADCKESKGKAKAKSSPAPP
uniref:Cleavage and polyadenylation specificity factor subunit 4 n=1 Tax=Amphimedon queenslandica TaxID=400682 RepID=A0A1X7SLT9_AMPQE